MPFLTGVGGCIYRRRPSDAGERWFHCTSRKEAGARSCEDAEELSWSRETGIYLRVCCALDRKCGYQSKELLGEVQSEELKQLKRARKTGMYLGDAACFGGVLKLVAYEVCQHVAGADGIACHVAGLRRLQRNCLCEA
jgi:hypothetical protein